MFGRTLLLSILTLCLLGYPGQAIIWADANQKDDGQANNKDDGQRNQKDDGQANNKDDGQRNQNDDGQANNGNNGQANGRNVVGGIRPVIARQNVVPGNPIPIRPQAVKPAPAKPAPVKVKRFADVVPIPPGAANAPAPVAVAVKQGVIQEVDLQACTVTLLVDRDGQKVLQSLPFDQTLEVQIANRPSSVTELRPPLKAVVRISPDSQLLTSIHAGGK